MPERLHRPGWVADDGFGRIPLTQNQLSIVDAASLEKHTQRVWKAVRIGKVFYAMRSYREDGRYKYALLHREIMEAPKGVLVDHINHDTLDNRRCNLRFASNSNNLANRGPQVNNTSGHKGVYWYTSRNKWAAHIQHKGKTRNLGYFLNIEDAIECYRKAATELFGEFACFE